MCALLDARRGEVYAGCWRLRPGTLPEELLAPRVAPVTDVVVALAGVAPLWVGQGAGRYAASLGEDAALQASLHPDARALLHLTALDPATCRVDDPAAWEPAYLRASGAERGVRG